MKELNKEILKESANRLLFDISDEECEDLIKEFQILYEEVEHFDELGDLSTVEPMTFPFINYSNKLREDEVGEVLTQEEALQNATSKKDGQIKIAKVI